MHNAEGIFFFKECAPKSHGTEYRGFYCTHDVPVWDSSFMRAMGICIYLIKKVLRHRSQSYLLNSEKYAKCLIQRVLANI